MISIFSIWLKPKKRAINLITCHLSTWWCLRGIRHRRTYFSFGLIAANAQLYQHQTVLSSAHRNKELILFFSIFFSSSFSFLAYRRCFFSACDRMLAHTESSNLGDQNVHNRDFCGVEQSTVQTLCAFFVPSCNHFNSFQFIIFAHVGVCKAIFLYRTEFCCFIVDIRLNLGHVCIYATAVMVGKMLFRLFFFSLTSFSLPLSCARIDERIASELHQKKINAQINSSVQRV